MDACAARVEKPLYSTSHSEIEGLLYFPNFLTAQEEHELIQYIDQRPYSEAIHRRQQFHGTWYYHTTHDVAAVQPATDRVERTLADTPFQALVDRLAHCPPYAQYEVFKRDGSNAPNQCLVNEYVRNQGISTHFEDTSSFGDTIMTVSLISPVFMTLSKPRFATNQCTDLVAQTRVLLEPRSCLIMAKECRYEWRHGISKTKILHMPDGRTVYRGEDYRRLSLTIRTVLEGRRKVEEDDCTWARHNTTISA